MKVVVYIAVATAAVLAWRAAGCNFGYWRQTRRLPLVIATDAELAETDSTWNWRERHWPNPGQPRKWDLSALQCRAYGAIAKSRQRTSQGVELFAGLMAATVLAYQWPFVGPAWNYLQHVTEVEANAVSPTWSSGPGALIDGVRPIVFSLLVIALVLAVSSIARDFAQLHEIYMHAALAQESERTAPEPPPRRRWWKRG